MDTESQSRYTVIGFDSGLLSLYRTLTALGLSLSLVMRADLGVDGIKGGATVSWSCLRVSEVFTDVAYSVANVVNSFCTFFSTTNVL